MNRTEPEMVVMRVTGDCKFCGRMLAANGRDLFHADPVCQEFRNEVALMGGEDLGRSSAVFVAETPPSVDTKTAN